MDIKTFQKKYNRLPTEFDRAYLLEIEREKVVSKFQILDTPYMHPGKCVNCGANQPDRKYLDFGLSVDMYGVVYWCTYCAKEMLNFLIAKGVIDPPVAKIPEFDEENYKLDLEDIKLIVGNIEKMLEERLAQHAGDSVSSIIDNESNTDLPVDSETEQATSRESTGTNEESTGRKKGASKSTSSTGSENISSLAEILGVELGS